MHALLCKGSQLIVRLTLLATFLSLSSCGLIDTVLGFAKSESSGGSRPNALKLRRVSLIMDEDSNDNWPVKIEIIRINDVMLVKEVLAISTEDWFKEKGETFRSANPKAYSDVWEIVPGTSIDNSRPQRVKGRVGGVLFCDLQEPKPAERISISGHILIKVGSDGCEVERFKR